MSPTMGHHGLAPAFAGAFFCALNIDAFLFVRRQPRDDYSERATAKWQPTLTTERESKRRADGQGRSEGGSVDVVVVREYRLGLNALTKERSGGSVVRHVDTAGETLDARDSRDGECLAGEALSAM